MTNIDVDIKGLDRAVNKLKNMPDRLQKNMNKAMELSLLRLWEAVRPYPPKPTNSKYRRTGTLGRSLGSSQSGGKTGGKPTVYSVTGTGRSTKGTFGTNLSYAKYVIDPQKQAYMHSGRWWTMDSIKKDALPKIKKVFYEMVKAILK